MTPESFHAFGQEIMKTAFLGKLWDASKEVLHEQWHGPKGQPSGWLGEGPVHARLPSADLHPPVAMPKPTPVNSLRFRAGQGLSRAAQQATSLGGLTRALPVGPKSLTLLGTLPAIPAALRKEDPTGKNRSRTERVAALGGNILGGMIGGGLMLRTRPGAALGAIGSNIIGGMAGGYVGEQLASAPFRLLMGRRPPTPQSMAQPQGGPYEPGY